MLLASRFIFAVRVDFVRWNRGMVWESGLDSNRQLKAKNNFKEFGGAIQHWGRKEWQARLVYMNISNSVINKSCIGLFLNICTEKFL